MVKKCRKPRQLGSKKAEKLTKANLKRLSAKRDKLGENVDSTPLSTEQKQQLLPDDNSSIAALIGAAPVIFDQSATPDVADPTAKKRRKRATWNTNKNAVPCNTYNTTPQKHQDTM